MYVYSKDNDQGNFLHGSWEDVHWGWDINFRVGACIALGWFKL